MTGPRLLFVCLGNICRSPTAEGIARVLAEARGIDAEIDSAGTGNWHVGHPPDPRMQAAVRAAGYDLSRLRARQVRPADFERFDVIYAMDRSNRADLEALRPPGNMTPLRLFREHDPEVQGAPDMPDPYYDDNFEEVVDMVARTAAHLLDDFSA